MRLSIHQLLEFFGDGQGDMLFVGAFGTLCARVFTAMTGINHDNKPAIDLEYRLLGYPRLRHGDRCGIFCQYRGIRIGSRQVVRQNGCAGRYIARHGKGFVRGIVKLLEQSHQRINRRIDVDDEAMLVFTCRWQDKNFRFYLGSKINDKTHHARLEIACAHLLDVGIIGLYFLRQILEHIAQIDILHIHNQAFRIFQHDHAVLDGSIGFERDAGIFGRGPDTGFADGNGSLRSLGAGQDKQGNNDLTYRHKLQGCASRRRCLLSSLPFGPVLAAQA